jgi:hypothetical protein
VRKVVVAVAIVLGSNLEDICHAAGIPLLLESSIKKGLDQDWGTPEAQTKALSSLIKQLDSLISWIQEQRLPQELMQEGSPLQRKLKTIERLRAQDLEPVPEAPTSVRIREGVARDRQCSIEDPQMRHGRKSKSQLFNGYKRHIVSDLDASLILACGITPANQPEKEVTPSLQLDLAHQGITVKELFIDRGYLDSTLASDVLKSGGQLICRPWTAANDNGLFSKDEFHIDLENQTITCPGQQTRNYKNLGQVVKFDDQTCASCELRSRCTRAANGRGRTVTIADDEPLQQQLRRQVKSPEGRERLRQRVVVEHHLAHIGRRQGPRARYLGVRKNLFDLRRTASLCNLEVIDRYLVEEKQERKAA